MLPSALRGTSGGASMTIPGGAGTPRKAHLQLPVLGASASLIGSELQPPALSSAPPRCPKSSSTAFLADGRIIPDEMIIPDRGRLERVMNLGENRIEMRIPRSAWVPRDLRFPHS